MSKTTDARDSCIDEIARLVISLPLETSFIGTLSFVPIAFDRTLDGSPSAHPVGYGTERLPFLSGDRILDALCGDRAQRCVDQQLLVDRQPVTPERYLALWRKTIQHAEPLSTLLTVHGLKLIAILEGPLGALKGMEPNWTSVPYATFDDFRERYADSMQCSNDRFRLELDIAEPDGARDAYIGEGFLQRLRNETSCFAGLEMRAAEIRLTHQSTLFDISEAHHVLQA